ncbi:hypothetical protein D3C72_1693810 [compost metagenome]
MRLFAHDCRQFLPDCANFGVVLPEHAELHRVTDRRTVLKSIDAAPHIGEFLVEQLLELLLHPLPCFAALRHHQHLAQIQIGRLHVEGQVESRRTVANKAGHCRNVRIALEQAFQLLDLALTRLERRSLRHPQVNNQFGPVGRRKELLGYCLEQQQ